MKIIKELIITFISLFLIQFLCVLFLKETQYLFFVGYLTYPFVKFLTNKK